MSSFISTAFARKIAEATRAVFGDSALMQSVESACRAYEHELTNIQASRGINALLVAIVGAKGQGKTWVARQLVQNNRIRDQLRSGDLIDDATTRLVWIGPVAPDALDPSAEIYHACPATDLVAIGQPYAILDTPGMTDANQTAAQLAAEALSLAPLKLLVVARDQLRAAANMSIAKQIDGAVCIPVITSVEPEELPGGSEAEPFENDLRRLSDELGLLASQAELTQAVFVPDFEITGDEVAAGEVFVGSLLDRLHALALTESELESTQERRLAAANQRLQTRVAELISTEIPQLASAVEQLNRETEQIPERVLASLLGSESVLETGVRMRLRAKLVADTSLLWFPYRTLMSTLNLTQGAWDRVMLGLAGSVPSIFGALSSMARNVRQNREFASTMHEGIRRATQEQVQERLQPLCHQFHNTVMKLRPRNQRSRDLSESVGMRLAGIEELQTRSQQIFDSAIEDNATPVWLVQVYAVVGVGLFWACMAGPIVLIYSEYFSASIEVLSGQAAELESFPHPSPGLLITSLLLSILPMAIYCMVVLTGSLSRRKIHGVAKQIVREHDQTIGQLQADQIIRLEFDDELLAQAEFLLNLQNDAS